MEEENYISDGGSTESDDLEMTYSPNASRRNSSQCDTDSFFGSIFDREEIISDLKNRSGLCHGNQVGLYNAAVEGDLEEVKRLCDLNPDNLEKEVALLIAALHSHAQVAHVLIKRGTNPNCVDSNGRTPLHLASLSGSTHCIQTLITAGADVNVWDKTMKTVPLICAASSGSLDAVKELMNSDANINAGINQGGGSALLYAVRVNAVDVVQYLLECGAQVSQNNKTHKKE